MVANHDGLDAVFVGFHNVLHQIRRSVDADMMRSSAYLNTLHTLNY